MSAQVWTIPLSPAQRWVLFNLSHAEGQKVNGQEGRRYRRFLRAFGLSEIATIVRRTGGKVRAAGAHDERALALHEVTAENVDYALKLAGADRTPMDEDIVGELFDLLEDLKAGRTYVAPEGLPDFDPAAEAKLWDPEAAAADEDKDDAPGPGPSAEAPTA